MEKVNFKRKKLAEELLGYEGSRDEKKTKFYEDLTKNLSDYDEGELKKAFHNFCYEVFRRYIEIIISLNIICQTFHVL